MREEGRCKQQVADGRWLSFVRVCCPLLLPSQQIFFPPFRLVMSRVCFAPIDTFLLLYLSHHKQACVNGLVLRGSATLLSLPSFQVVLHRHQHDQTQLRQREEPILVEHGHS